MSTGSTNAPEARALEKIFVKIHGAMRTGTNYLAWMLKNNYVHVEPLSLILGWKHGPFRFDTAALTVRTWEDPRVVQEFERFPTELHAALANASPLIEAAKQEFERGQIRYAVICKHPCEWFASVRRYGDTFLGYSTDPRTLAHVWNSSYRDWASNLPPLGVLVRWEELVRAPEGALDRIAPVLKLTRTLRLRTPTHTLVPGESEEINLWFYNEEQQPGFWNEPPRARSRSSAPESKTTDEELETFRQHLDRELVDTVGYHLR